MGLQEIEQLQFEFNYNRLCKFVLNIITLCMFISNTIVYLKITHSNIMQLQTEHTDMEYLQIECINILQRCMQHNNIIWLHYDFNVIVQLKSSKLCSFKCNRLILCSFEIKNSVQLRIQHNITTIRLCTQSHNVASNYTKSCYVVSKWRMQNKNGMGT